MQKRVIELSILLTCLICIVIITTRLFFIKESATKTYNLAIYLDDKIAGEMPGRGNYSVNVDCKGDGNGYFNYQTWGVVITDFIDGAVCDVTFKKGIKFNDYLINTSKSDKTLTYIEQEDTVQTKDNAKEEYRYTGKNVNNYVYFGCDNDCTENNLYRIIGVFPTQSISGGTYEKRVKLIKANFYSENESGLLGLGEYSGGLSGYQWNSVNSNNWETSTTQLNVLNGVYWKNLGKYQKYIGQAIWYLGAPTYPNTSYYFSEKIYADERSENQSYSKGSLFLQAYIGLMYPSDYGFAAGKNYDIFLNGNSGYLELPWLYIGNDKYYEFLMNAEHAYSDGLGVVSWSVEPRGNVSIHQVSIPQFYFSIRPTFYLKENIEYSGGIGTKENPYLITVGEL